MATKYDSEGFVSTPLKGQGVRRKDSYFLASEADEDQFQAADSEYRKLKADFARIARSRRQHSHSKSENSEALRQSDDKACGDQLICRNLR